MTWPKDRPYPVDRQLENADWTKQTWDLDLTPERVAAMPADELEHLMRLPSWKAAPDDIREAAESRGY